jgi:hypothetical protein
MRALSSPASLAAPAQRQPADRFAMAIDFDPSPAIEWRRLASRARIRKFCTPAIRQ